MQPKPRALAFYLPQFHPIPENDLWWGKGFTEWINVAKARPLFRGHYQPHVPADLGFYDLRLPESRKAQAEMARHYGIEGFCYWHYWFGNGQRLLERPFSEVVASGKPDFPFCLAWANETWTGKWHGAPKRVLAQQSYPGPQDHVDHFYSLLPAFQDPRYVMVNGLRVFVIHKPSQIPELPAFLELWNNLANKEGIGGFYFIANGFQQPDFGFHGVIDDLAFLKMPGRGMSLVTKLLAVRSEFSGKYATEQSTADPKHPGLKPLLNQPDQKVSSVRRIKRELEDSLQKIIRRPKFYRYQDYFHYFQSISFSAYQHPVSIPNWDNTPRSGYSGVVLRGSSPQLFQELCASALAKVEQQPDSERRLVFVKSWNEWAEGNYLEPDLRYGHQYLEALKSGLNL